MKRVACLGLMVLSSGCFYPAERGRLLEAKVDKLSAQNDELTAKLDATLPKIDEKIAEVSAALESLDKASRRSGADISVQLQKTMEDVAALRGQIESYVHRADNVDQRLTQALQDIEKRGAALQDADGDAPTGDRRRAEEVPRPTDKKEYLTLANTRAKADDRAVARQLYGEIIKKWPRDPVAGEAHFGLGETFVADNKCREALFEYGKVIQDFPKAPSAPQAYLRSSECFAKLGMKSESKLALEELLKSHPKSDAARKAKTLLSKDTAAKKKKEKS